MRKVDVKEKARNREKRILELWREEDTFRKSIENGQGKPSFIFYEGPPTANGAPHIGHVLGRVIKDFICRYKTMSGYQVLRKAGWDTHGLPVELGVEKQLGISGKQEIENYGIAPFVEKCKNSVFEYEKQWRELTEAIGYWTDMEHPYVTLTNDYIESVWYLLANIHKKGLLYKGHRVSPYCPSCQTTLSSHEVAQGYEDVKDLSATVKFRSEQGSFLAWTTTPWTLPANVALAINGQLEYVKVKRDDEIFIIAEALVEKVMSGSEYEVISTHKGAEFIGVSYQAPFAFAAVSDGHRVIDADFVSAASGTGIVHIAPAHGEDDYRVAKQHGISMLSVVNAAGRYTDEVAPFAGRFVKDCDIDIVKNLSERGLLFAKERYEHSYPFCWRCKSPLLYYAMESWFIQTTAVKEQLIANNKEVEWYPGHVREGRFGKFLEELVDWNISRNRYWGTPLNVWVCGECGGEYAPYSHADLREKSLHPIAADLELHKPYIDEVRLVCPHCSSGTMERTSEVIDVWFDSGSMPFAQVHYPFENETLLANQYPADMICEGIDQTRGWFFSLLAVSTLYNGRAPYKKVMAHGHILDENGQKMSKSKGNVIDPWEIIEEFGTDAFRWAILTDSAPWNNKRFSKQIVAEAKSKVVDTLHNTHAFYVLYASLDGFKPEEHARLASIHHLDRWILSRLHSLLRTVSQGLEANDFLNPGQSIEMFIDELSNWYIRRSRDRFWGSEMTADKVSAYQTLREVLLLLSRMIAPYAPFIAEDLYENLGGVGSVHMADYPHADESQITSALEEEMQIVRQIVELARSVRNETAVKTRQPLAELKISLDRDFDLARYRELIQDEINVKAINIEKNDSSFVDFTLKLNLKLSGPKYGKHVAELQSHLRHLLPEEARTVVEQGEFTFVVNTGEELHIPLAEMLVEKQAKQGFGAASGYQITVALNTTLTPELEQEGLVREVIRAVQDYRKKLDLPIEKRVHLVLDADEQVKDALTNFSHVLHEHVLLSQVSFAKQLHMEVVSLGEASIGMLIQD